jgi:hypothetical protein
MPAEPVGILLGANPRRDEVPLEVTAAVYGLPLDEVQAVARHYGFARDALGYFLDTFTDPPLRLDAGDVHFWYADADPATHTVTRAFCDEGDFTDDDDLPLPDAVV